jgi:hypothetical protein
LQKTTTRRVHRIKSNRIKTRLAYEDNSKIPTHSHARQTTAEKPLLMVVAHFSKVDWLPGGSQRRKSDSQHSGPRESHSVALN